MAEADAREIWLLMGDLVLDRLRRRAVAEATGMSFGRARALRRLAPKPMSMREFADAMDIDPPNATTLIADMEGQGLVRRRPHPTDGRAKLVEATAAGKRAARKADEVMTTPPEGLVSLDPEDLKTLRRILEQIRG